MNLILGTRYAAIGLALVVWATPLSIRYNAWTTRLRERHPNGQSAANSGTAGTEYQDHDVSGCWCVPSFAFDHESLAADRH